MCLFLRKYSRQLVRVYERLVNSVTVMSPNLMTAGFLAGALAGGAIASSIISFPSFAHVPESGFEIQDFLKQSDLAFYGEIIRIDYADPSGLSTSKSDTKSQSKRKWAPILNGPPHTFVTYRIIEPIYGNSGRKNVTLRFYGGPDGKGSIFDTSASPTFIKGERQLMVISGNGRLRTPTVLGELGQFRENRGGVYSTHGVALTGFNKKDWFIFEGGIHPQLSFKVYPTPSFEGVSTNDDVAKTISKMGMTMREAKLKYEKEAPENIINKLVQIPKTKPARPISMKEFVKRLQRISKKLPAPKNKFVSQDPRQKFKFIDLVGVQAPPTARGGSNSYDPNRWAPKKK